MAGRLHHHRLVRSGTVLAAAAAVLAGCFYTGAINDRPSAEIRRTSTGEILRGSVQTFAAVLEDPNGDPLTTHWNGEACNQDGVCASIQTGTAPVFDVAVPVDVEGKPTVQLRVHLDVADSYGAVARPPQLLELPVGNRPPTVTIQPHGRDLGGRFPTDVPIVVSIEAGDPDRDEVTLDVQLFPARASNPADRRWTELPPPVAGGRAWELLPDVDGEWRVRVIASDGVDELVGERTLIVAPDQAPCLGALDPAPAPAGLVLDAPRRLTVLSVDDDLDIYPWPPPDDPYLGPAELRWSVRAPGATGFAEVARDVAALELDPAQFAPGDLVGVRVEVGDRTGRTVACGPDAPTCSDRQDTCLQRQTWFLEVR